MRCVELKNAAGGSSSDCAASSPCGQDSEKNLFTLYHGYHSSLHGSKLLKEDSVIDECAVT
jgi:hypothetical protein